VTVAGVGFSGYNGTFPVVSVLSTTQFTYIAGATGLANSGGGTSSSATVTVQTSAAHGLSAGQLVTISGVGVAGYNGTFSVANLIDATHFTYYAASGGLAASGGGTATAAGNVSQGVHQCCVIFQTRQGYLTVPGPATRWTASGGKRAVVTNIPTGLVIFAPSIRARRPHDHVPSKEVPTSLASHPMCSALCRGHLQCARLLMLIGSPQDRGLLLQRLVRAERVHCFNQTTQMNFFFRGHGL